MHHSLIPNTKRLSRPYSIYTYQQKFMSAALVSSHGQSINYFTAPHIEPSLLQHCVKTLTLLDEWVWISRHVSIDSYMHLSENY